jgi:hypothetical protein
MSFSYDCENTVSTLVGVAEHQVVVLEGYELLLSNAVLSRYLPGNICLRIRLKTGAQAGTEEVMMARSSSKSEQIEIIVETHSWSDDL